MGESLEKTCFRLVRGIPISRKRKNGSFKFSVYKDGINHESFSSLKQIYQK